MPRDKTRSTKLQFRVQTPYANELRDFAESIGELRGVLFRRWVQEGYEAEKARLEALKLETPAT